MARIIVTSDADESRKVFDEHVDPELLDESHVAEQFIQRLAWAISYAELLAPPRFGEA
jgi:hypothetical protein